MPNAVDAYVKFTNSAAAGTDLSVGLSGSPFTVGTLIAVNNVAANSVVIGATTTDTDILRLAVATGVPTVSVSSGTLRMNAGFEGTQGLSKTGAGTLSFRENPHPQTYTGTVRLDGGTLVIGADSDLGAATNPFVVGSTSQLLASPLVSSTPVTLGSVRPITLSAPLTLGSLSDSGVVEVSGPLSGSGSLSFNGIGSLVLSSGYDTRSGNFIYKVLPGTTVSALTRSSAVRFASAETARAVQNKFWLDFGSAPVSSSAISAKIDLGGYTHRFNNFAFAPSGIHTASADSQFIVEITNGELISSLPATNFIEISAHGGGVQSELRLPASTTVTGTGGYLSVGNYASTVVSKINSSRVRIGTQAVFNLSTVTVGVNGASGRIDALAPGSSLKLRGANTTDRLGTLQVGNFASGNVARADALIDLTDGAVDILASTLSVGNGNPAYPATAWLKFGNGTLDASDVSIGSTLSGSRTIDFGIMQAGGNATIGNLSFGSGNTTGSARLRYQLQDGILSVGNLTAGNQTGTFSRRLEWSGGLIRNLSGRSAVLDTASGANAPLDLVLSGTVIKALGADAGKSITLGPGTRLVADSPETLLVLTGTGIILLASDTSQFLGTLEYRGLDSILDMGPSSNPFTLNAGSLHWVSGSIGFNLGVESSSDRIKLAGVLDTAPVSGRPAPPPALYRYILLRNGSGSGTYTLATYDSTNLALGDFLVQGVPSGYSAEFTIGPTALTVTLSPETAYTAWRRARISSGTANTGFASDTADPDGDGRPNLLEYALGSSPTAADTEAALVPTLTPSDPRSLQLTFRRIADPALTYTVRAAASPSGPWDEVVFTSTGTDNTDGPLTVQDTVALTDQPGRFLRLFVSR